MGNLATMSAPTTNTKRRTVHCSKHAFAPIASFRPKNAVSPSVTLPAQRHQSGLGRAGLASESPFTGDDPVNGTDPLGLYWGQGTLDRVRHDVASGADTTGNAIKSFGDGLVGQNYCGTNGAAYDAGNVFYWIASVGGAAGSAYSEGGVNGNSTDTEGASGNFSTVVGPEGIELPGVPGGVTGVVTATGRGVQYAIPEGTSGLDSRVASLRIMGPVTTGKYQYPNGYVVYMNESGQTVNPLTGQTISNSDPFAHIPLP